MSKRIFNDIVLAAIWAVLLTALLVVPALYSSHEEIMTRELRQEADGIVCALELTDDDPAYLARLHTDSRLTLIAPDGTVLYDSQADPAQMESHAERPEVLQALETGAGESTRTSDTFSETTLYYARRTDDGCVLRIANTRRSVLGAFLSVLPLLSGLLLGVVLVCMLMARRIARRIVAPINALNLDRPLENNAYDELAPLLTRMHRQHEQLLGQMQALENARAELSAVMANMREGMILLDSGESILSINESAARLFDTALNKAVGRKLLSVHRDADLHELVQQALQGQGGVLPLRRGDRQYDVYVSPVLKKGEVCGAVLLILDVTERFAAEESRREFTANVSHELKTPLTSISGFAEIIRDGIAQPQDVQRFAGMICKESSRLISLVNDILELSRLDERQSLGPKEPVSLLPLLSDVKDELALSASQKQLTVDLSGDEATVCGYPVLLREMFFNLIDNAVKYTPEGGSVSISVVSGGDQVSCTVSDTGVGIPREHQTHVFERFYRVDKSHSRLTGGTGLGLAIVKHVAQLHGAALTLDSAEGQGTRIQLTFPPQND